MIWKILLAFLQKNFVIVAMRMEKRFLQYFHVYNCKYNKTILEYAQIARSEPKSMIPDMKVSLIITVV